MIILRAVRSAKKNCSDIINPDPRSSPNKIHQLNELKWPKERPWHDLVYSTWTRDLVVNEWMTDYLHFNSTIIIQGAALKNDPTPKMCLLSNSWKFLRQILYTCSAGTCPLMCCFSLKLVYIYKIDIMPNFKCEFCNCTSLFLRDVTFRRIIFKFTGKKTAIWTT